MRYSLREHPGRFASARPSASTLRARSLTFYAVRARQARAREPSIGRRSAAFGARRTGRRRRPRTELVEAAAKRRISAAQCGAVVVVVIANARVGVGRREDPQARRFRSRRPMGRHPRRSKMIDHPVTTPSSGRNPICRRASGPRDRRAAGAAVRKSTSTFTPGKHAAAYFVDHRSGRSIFLRCGLRTICQAYRRYVVYCLNDGGYDARRCLIGCTTMQSRCLLVSYAASSAAKKKQAAVHSVCD